MSDNDHSMLNDAAEISSDQSTELGPDAASVSRRGFLHGIGGASEAGGAQ